MSIIRLFDNARETSQEAEKVTCHVSSLSCRGVANYRNGIKRRSRWLILPRVSSFQYFCPQKLSVFCGSTCLVT